MAQPVEIVKAIIKAVEGVVTVKWKNSDTFDPVVVEVTSGAPKLLAAKNKSRAKIIIRNTSGAEQLYIGNSTVTMATAGIKINAGGAEPISPTSAEIYGISSGANINAVVTEL